MEYGLKEVDFLGVWFEHTIRQSRLLSFDEDLIQRVVFDEVGYLEFRKLQRIGWCSFNLLQCQVEFFEDLSIEKRRLIFNSKSQLK